MRRAWFAIADNRRCVCSGGLANWRNNQPFDTALATSDQALHAAKREGRDRTVA
jgi:PleD family two-component response regulator